MARIDFAVDSRLAGLIADAERGIRTLNDEGGAALNPLARLLLRTESIASSKVEGLQLGTRQLARAEAEIDHGDKGKPTAREVLANIDAMTLAVEEAAATDPFALPVIRAIHHRLMTATARPESAGVVRTVQNWIGGNDYTPCGADFVPPPPDELAALLDDLCLAINDESLSPLVQAALVHAQFETIHPFEDGNGRTGRALIHVVLRRRGLAPHFVPPLSVIFAGAREKYIAGLASFRGPDVSAWLEQFATATWEACRLAMRYLGAVRAQQESWRERLSASAVAPRRDAAAWAIIDLLPAHPILSGPMAIAATGRAKAAVYDSIDRLVTAGVLVPLSENRRNRLWEAEGMLSLMEDLEAGAFAG